MRIFSMIFGLVLAVAGASAEAVHAATSKTITLNSNSNQAVLEDDGIPTNRLVRIRSLNGSFATVTFELPTVELIINLGSGDDTLTVDGTGISGFAAKLTINGNAGNDSANIRKLVSKMGVCWNDTQGTRQALAISNCSLTGLTQMIDGTGIAEFSVGSSHLGAVSVTSPDGNLNFSVFNSTIDGRVNVNNKGYGTDRISFESAITNNTVYLSMGNGPVSSTAFFSTFHGDFSLLAGSGTMTTFVGTCLFSTIYHQSLYEGISDTSINYTSAGVMVDLQNGLGFDKTLLRNLNVPLLNIQNGDGGSHTRATSGIDFPDQLEILSATITNGEGSDTFTTQSAQPFTKPGHFHSLTINNGSGNSTLELTEPLISVDDLHFVSGSGYDALSFGAMTLGTLVADLHDGGSKTTFVGTHTIGLVDIFGGAENDEIWLYGDATHSGPVNVHLGGGSDLAIFIPLGRLAFLSSLVIDGGLGNDTISSPPNAQTFPGYLEITGFEFGI